MAARRRSFAYYDEPYIVEVKNKQGEWVPYMRYAADEYQQAVEKTNAVDRRRDVRLIKLPTDWRSVLDRKFDALEVYIRSL